MGQDQSVPLQQLNSLSINSDEERQAQGYGQTQPSYPTIKNALQERRTMEKVAAENAAKLKTKHNALVKEIKEQQLIKQDNEIALKNMRELLDKLRVSNNKLESELDQHVKSLETSQRKIWYTNKREEKYAWFSNLLTIIVRIVLFFSIIYLLYQKKYISLVVILVIYLLIMHFL